MWKLFFRIERIKAVRIVIDNSIATPFHIIIIDDTVLSILQTYSRFQENSLISFNNHISSNTLHSGNITLDRELSEIFRQMIQQFLLIIQREVLVHKWTNVEYWAEEYAGDVFMGDGDNDSVNDSTHHQLINDTMQRFNYSAVLKISRTVGQEEKKRQALHTKKTLVDYPRTLAACGRCTRYGGGRVSRIYSMGSARSRSISKLL